MRSNSKAHISGLAASTHARNRTLPDLPSARPWEIWVRDYEHLLRYLRALPTIRVHPILDGRTLDIVHSLNEP